MRFFMSRSYFKDSPVLFFSILIFVSYFLYRLYDLSLVLYSYPLDSVNDMASYITQLYFLDVCGYHQFCPYWYGGFVSFLITPPGWFFFAYPFYFITHNAQFGFYFSVLASFVLGFVFVWFFGKKFFSWNSLERVLFFLLLFATPFALGDFIRLGRAHELLAWVLFLPFVFLILYYRNKPLHGSFFLVIPLLAGILITYFSVAIFAFILLFSLFLVMKGRDRLFVFFCGIGSPLFLRSAYFFFYYLFVFLFFSFFIFVKTQKKLFFGYLLLFLQFYSFSILPSISPSF